MPEATQDIERLQKKRPAMTDQKEMEIIREIYFKEPGTHLQDIELSERYERGERRQKFKRKSSR